MIRQFWLQEKFLRHSNMWPTLVNRSNRIDAAIARMYVVSKDETLPALEIMDSLDLKNKGLF